MGMESYYMGLSVKGSNSSADITQLFKQKYSVSEYKMPTGRLFRRYIIDHNRFVIDKKAVVAISNSQSITEISFELCFSNYECNLSYIFNVAQWVDSLFDTTKLKVLNNEYNFDNLSYDQFKTIIFESFSNKFHYFQDHYGVINADILPHDFYNWIRRMGVKGKS